MEWIQTLKLSFTCHSVITIVAHWETNGARGGLSRRVDNGVGNGLSEFVDNGMGDSVSSGGSIGNGIRYGVGGLVIRTRWQDLWSMA